MVKKILKSPLDELRHSISRDSQTCTTTLEKITNASPNVWPTRASAKRYILKL